ncbi:MAG: HAD family hydrolase [Candidatus Cryptobacteroides sp.]
MRRNIALFDLDGVILDTENFYTQLWSNLGEHFFGEKNFGIKIKGQTLVKIMDDYFPSAADRKFIIDKLDDFERNMPYDYIPGAEQFIRSLKPSGIKSAVVTSSNKVKMENVYRKHPDFRDLFDYILTSEDFTESKPSPECYLKGMKLLGGNPETSIVFEDSVSGLQSGKSSGAFVVGLTTTNPSETVSQYADLIIPDFTIINPDEVF